MLVRSRPATPTHMPGPHPHPHPLPLAPRRPLLSNGEAPSAETLPSTVFGPTCDGLDTLLTEYALPELQVIDRSSSRGLYQ